MCALVNYSPDVMTEVKHMILSFPVLVTSVKDTM